MREKIIEWVVRVMAFVVAFAFIRSCLKDRPLLYEQKQTPYVLLESDPTFDQFYMREDGTDFLILVPRSEKIPIYITALECLPNNQVYVIAETVTDREGNILKYELLNEVRHYKAGGGFDKVCKFIKGMKPAE